MSDKTEVAPPNDGQMFRLYDSPVADRANVAAPTIRAQFEPSSLNAEERTIEVVFATPRSVDRYVWNDRKYEYEAVDEVLSITSDAIDFERMNGSGVPLYDNHRYWNGLDGVLGVCTSGRIVGDEARCVVRFAKTESGNQAMALVADGIVRTFSVGYKAEYERYESPDRAKPEYRAIRWTPMEVSMAPMPADPKSVVRTAVAAPSGGSEGIDNNVNTRKVDVNNDPAATGTQTPPTTPAPAPQAVDNSAVERAAITVERTRVEGIMTAARAAGISDVVMQKAITDGVSADQFRAQVIQEMAERQSATQTFTVNDHSNASARGDERAAKRQAIIGGTLLRAAYGNAATKEQAETGKQYRSYSLMDLARMSAEADGWSSLGRSAEEIIGRAFTSSTSDFPVILGGVIHQVLLADYSIQPDTWSEFCAVGSVVDFRPHSRLRMGSFSRLKKVRENGEFEYLPIDDARKESIIAESFGNLVNITRKMIINDDLGAFTRLASQLGRAAARSIEVDVYALLAENSGLGPTMSDGNTLFHATHNNIGTGSALSAAGIMGDRNLFRRQKDESGNDFINIRPSVLLIPTELYDTAVTINSAEYNPDAQANKAQYNPNTVRGLFEKVIDTPYLAAGSTRRYLFSRPTENPVLEVAFLNGVREPRMEMQQGFSVDGVTWKVAHDYAVGAIDWKGAVTNAGA